MSVLKKVYSAIQPSSTQAITGKRTAELADEEPNLLHEAHALISDSRSVIESYLGMNESLKRHKLELPAGTLKKDKQDIKEVLECGRQHGEDIAEDYLLPNTYTSAEAGRTKINGHQQTAAEMFQDSRKTVQDGAGAVIAQQMLGFRQLVDAIPRDRNRS